MKKQIAVIIGIIIVSFLCAKALARTEIIIPVKAIPELQAARLRVLPGELRFDRTSTWRVEFLNANGTINDRREVVLTRLQTRQWLGADATNQILFLKGLILSNTVVMMESDTNVVDTDIGDE